MYIFRDDVLIWDNQLVCYSLGCGVVSEVQKPHQEGINTQTWGPTTKRGENSRNMHSLSPSLVCFKFAMFTCVWHCVRCEGDSEEDVASGLV